MFHASFLSRLDELLRRPCMIEALIIVLPKTRKMKRLHRHIQTEDQAEKIIFQQLFELQLQLEKLKEFEMGYCFEVKKVISSIDDLMEVILDETK